MYYIGVDLGTSSVKLLLMNEAGKVVRTVSKEYPIFFPKQGWSEQNPEDWYEATVVGIQELVSGYDANEIHGISFGGQMHGLVVLDEQDRVIRPAILWNDGRTIKECEYLNEVVGRNKLTEYTANIAFAGFTAPKILWMKENEPENFKRICKIMLPKDYLAYRMTGVFCTDVSDASGMLLFDVKKRKWSEEMLAICGIRKECLAQVFESYECVGNLTQKAAHELGLLESVKVIAGAGDNAAAAIGTGTVGEGRCNISLGTSGTIFISSKEFCVDDHNALHAFAHADGGYHLMGCMLSAASCNKWWLDDIIQIPDHAYAKEQEKITEQMLGRNSVFYLPYLMGERSPHNDAFARGTFTGMTMDTTRTDMTQAVLEGVAFAIRDSLEVARELGIRIERTTICGGGAKSPLWRQIIANVLNIQVDVLEQDEGPALGAAMLAAVGCGAFENVEDASNQSRKIIETIRPDRTIANRYEKKYQQFRKLYPALKHVFAEIAQNDEE